METRPPAPPAEQAPPPEPTKPADVLPPRSPEKLGIAPEYVGLQTRLLLHGTQPNALKPSFAISNLEAPQLGKLDTRDYGLFERRSLEERKAHQKAKYPEMAFDQTYQAWRSKTTATINKEKFADRRAQLQRLARIVNHGAPEANHIDFENFNEAALDQLYARYFGDDENGVSRMKMFVADVVTSYIEVQTVETPEGQSPSQVVALNMEALEQDMDTIQWIAGMFGGNSKEIAAQLVAGEAKILANSQQLIDEAMAGETARVNQPNLRPREEELLRFLESGVVADKPTTPKTEPTSPTTPADDDEQQSKEPWTYVKRNPEKPEEFAFPLKYSLYDQTHDPATLLRLLKEKYKSSGIPYPEFEGKTDDEIMALIKKEVEEMDSYVESTHVRTHMEAYADFLATKYKVKIAQKAKDTRIVATGGRLVDVLGTSIGGVYHGSNEIVISLKKALEQIGRPNAKVADIPPSELEEIMAGVGVHEFSHVLWDVAYLYPQSQVEPGEGEAPLPEQDRAFIPGKFGTALGKPDRAFEFNPEASGRAPYRERGEQLMEGITQKLVLEWIAEKHPAWSDVNKRIYHHERLVVDELIRSMLKQGTITNPEEGFKYFVDAYFKPNGLLGLARAVEGKTTDGASRARPHLMEITYALMEFEAERAKLTGYELTTAVIREKRPLDAAQQDRLRQVIEGAKVKNPRIQLSPGAIKVLEEEFLS